MSLYRLFSVLLVLLACKVLYAGDIPRKITMIEEAKRVSQREIRKASQSESEKNTDGGYNANVNVIDCFAAMEYRYTGGRYVDEPVKFRMLFPEVIKSGKKYPLVVWFHGVGESGEDNTRQLSHVQSTIEYLAGKNKLDCFMIVTQCPSDNRQWQTSISTEGKGDAPMTIVEEIMEAAIKEYPIDENRLSVFGLCSGGDAAWSIIGRHPGKFAAMVACTAAPGNANVQDFKNTAVWAFTNKDDPVPWEAVERFVNAINASGGKAHVTLRESGGHDAWSNALFTKQVIGWMVLQDLHKGGPPMDVICYHRTAKQVFFHFGLPVLGILCLIPFYYRNKVST